LFKGLTDGLTHNRIYLCAKSGHQGLGVFQDQLPNGFPQTPFQYQVYPLQNTLYQLRLQLVNDY
jgi:hypothetical protein